MAIDKDTKIIAFCNQKGGTGKTTTCLNVASCLARANLRVLVIDADPQASLTLCAGKSDLGLMDLTTYEVMKGQDVADAVIDNVLSGFDLVPSDIRMCKADLEFAGIPGREFLLRDSLQYLKRDYDYILIDCPPNLSVVTLNCLTFAKEIIVPLQAQYLAVGGLGLLTDTIYMVQQRLNKDLKVFGVVLTMFDKRTNHSKQIEKLAEQYFEGKIFDTKIRRSVKLAEASAEHKDILQYDSGSPVADDYIQLTVEILKRGGMIEEE